MKRRLAVLGLLAVLAALLTVPLAVYAQSDATAPGNLTAEIVDGGVVLSWDAPAEDAESVTGYEILRRRPNQGENRLTTFEANTGSTATTYTDTSATEPGESYIYRVKALRDAERSKRSNNVRVDLPDPTPEPTPEPTATPEPTDTAPAQPQGLTGTAAHDAVSLSWDDPGDDSITGYQVLRRDRAIHAAGDMQIHVEDTGSADASYTDETVAPEGSYVYRIKARSAAGLSEISHWFRVDTPAEPEPEPTPEPTPPAQPQGLTGTAAHDAVSLTWDKPGAEVITGYQILRRELSDPGEAQVHVEDTGVTASYVDRDVEPETGYGYRIRARNEAGLSPQSDEFTVNTPAAPDPDAAPGGAADLGDITGLAKPRFPVGTIDGGGDAVDYYRFEIKEPKKLGLGLREQETNSDLFLEDADGNVLHSRTRAGTANEWMTVTLLAGTYYVRIAAQEPGESSYMFRYGVGTPDPDEVARLEAEAEESDDDSPLLRNHETPDPNDPDDPDDVHNSTDTTSVLNMPGVGRTRVTQDNDNKGRDHEISIEGDVDWHRMAMIEGDMYTIGVFGSDSNGYKSSYISDPVVAIYDSDGNMVAINGVVAPVDHKYVTPCHDCSDDLNVTSLSPYLSFFAPEAGDYYLAVWASKKSTSERDFNRWKRRGLSFGNEVDFASTGFYSIKIANETLLSTRDEDNLSDADGWHGYPAELWLDSPNTKGAGYLLVTGEGPDQDSWKMNLQGGDRYCVHLHNVFTGRTNPQVGVISQSDDNQNARKQDPIPQAYANKGEIGRMQVHPIYTGPYQMTVGGSTGPDYDIWYKKGNCPD